MKVFTCPSSPMAGETPPWHFYWNPDTSEWERMPNDGVNPDMIDWWTYDYGGYAYPADAPDLEDILVFFGTVYEGLQDPPAGEGEAFLDQDVYLPAPIGKRQIETVYRLREGIERFFITDINNPAGSAMAQSDIPVFWDILSNPAAAEGGGGVGEFNHVPGGCNVGYFDGHVEFVRYPSEEFPVCEGLAFQHGVVPDFRQYYPGR
jgi:prepilin-type processing-associated H-X9-DG protein